MNEKTCHPDAVKNLAGVQCPMNLVYVKVALAKLQAGQVLEVLVDDGPPAVNIEKFLAKEGHKLLGKARQPGKCWSLLVRKNGACSSAGEQAGT